MPGMGPTWQYIPRHVSETVSLDAATATELARRARTAFSRSEKATADATANALAIISGRTRHDGIDQQGAESLLYLRTLGRGAAAASPVAPSRGFAASPISPMRVPVLFSPLAVPFREAAASAALRCTPEEFAARFEVAHAIGAGTRCSVRAAVDRATGLPAAVKVVFGTSTGSAEADRELVEFELYALHRCAHQHVVRLLGASDVGVDTYIAMEHCERGDLMQFVVRPWQLSEAAVARMMRELALALAHVHAMGIIHLDVKPANVLLARDGGVRLADFGVASVAPARRRRGTPLFVAPEILNSGLAGRAADAWSYGVVVYLLLVGFPPFFLHERGTRSELEEQIKRGDFGFPPTYWGGYSEESRDFIRRLLVVEESRRMTMAGALEHPWLARISAAHGCQSTG